MKRYPKIRYAIAVSFLLAITALAYFSIFYDSAEEEGIQSIYRYENAINVREAGAKGDGETDDTAAIQASIDRAAESGRIVYVPYGTYVINQEKPLNIPSGTKLYGDGKESVLQADSGRFGWELLGIQGQEIDIRHMRLDGNNAVNRVIVVRAGSSQVSLTNSFVANASQSDDESSKYYTQVVAGIVVYGETSDIQIQNTEISNVYAKHATGGSRIARGIHLTNTWSSIERVAKRVDISNSYIHDIGPADHADCIYYEDPNIGRGEVEETGSIIRDNQFARCAKSAVNIRANGVVVEHNRIINSYLGDNLYMDGAKAGKKAPDMYAGITVNADNVTIRNNTLEGVGSYYAGIEIGGYVRISGITVTGNKIYMGKASDIQDTTGIRIGNADHYTITSNWLENGSKGIWTWLSSSNGVIEGNTISMPKGGGIDLSTYLKPNFQQKITVKNNIIKAYNFEILLDSRNREVTVVGSENRGAS